MIICQSLLTAHELQVRLQVGQRMIEIQDKLSNALVEVTKLASHDPLTDLFNRRAIMEAIPREIKRVERLKQSLCIGMCDIDHFKPINDTYGHLVGDEVIKEVAVRIQKALRDYDLVGRYGGEEFLVITPQDQADGTAVYQRICDEVSSTPIVVDEHSINVTISCGISTYCPGDKYDESFVLTRADNGLGIKPKTTENRNCVVQLNQASEHFGSDQLKKVIFRLNTKKPLNERLFLFPR